MKKWSIFVCFALLFLINKTSLGQDLQKGEVVFSNMPVIAKYKFLIGPTNQGESIMELSFSTLLGQPIRLDYSLSVLMYMPEMGHAGAPVKIEVVPAQIGLYLVRKMFFYHNGKWEVRISLKSRNGLVETKTILFLIDGNYCYQPDK